MEVFACIVCSLVVYVWFLIYVWVAACTRTGLGLVITSADKFVIDSAAY